MKDRSLTSSEVDRMNHAVLQDLAKGAGGSLVGVRLGPDTGEVVVPEGLRATLRRVLTEGKPLVQVIDFSRPPAAAARYALALTTLARQPTFLLPLDRESLLSEAREWCQHFITAGGLSACAPFDGSEQGLWDSCTVAVVSQLVDFQVQEAGVVVSPEALSNLEQRHRLPPERVFSLTLSLARTLLLDVCKEDEK